MAQIPTNLRQIESLVEIVAQLRGPQGCPWDKEQSHESLTQYAIEETHELVEAIELSSNDTSRDQKIKDELGDVLFQVLLHAQLAAERGAFTLTDVIENLGTKLVRRHPHVFADTQVEDTAEVIRNWEKIKLAEKQTEKVSPYSLNVPPLPALQRAYKIGKRTEKLQFDWENAEQVMVKVEEEFSELREALEEGTDHEIQHELGDVLFSLAQLGRHLEMEPEQVLRRTNQRFERRFNKMVELIENDGKSFNSMSLSEKEAYWQNAKKILKPSEGKS